MKNVACVLFAIGVLGACVAEPSDVEDGRDDSFLGGDGKADTGSVVEGSPDALAVLQVANERGADEMHNHGVPKRAAENIVAVRLGDDGVAGTSDDVTFGTLAQLDAVPYVGPQAFARLLAYADEIAGSMPTTTPLTPPADLWHVAACSPITWSQLVAKFGAGQTSYSFGRPYATVARQRDACNPITGCTPWKVGGRLWLHDGPNSSIPLVPVPAATRGDLEMSLNPANGGIGIVAEPDLSNDEDYRFDCDAAAQTGLTGPLTCLVSMDYDYSQGGRASFSGDRFSYTQAEMHGRWCADGSFHFTTSVLNDDSNSLQNLVQVTLYGQLF